MATDEDAPAKPESPAEQNKDTRDTRPEPKLEVHRTEAPRPEPVRPEPLPPPPTLPPPLSASPPRADQPLRVDQPLRAEPPADKLTETIRQRLEHLVPELVKKTFAAGMGAVFQTEEGIRRIARDVSLPDVAGYIASTPGAAKDKVFEVIARETRDFLSNLNLTEEIAKILTTLSFEIKTEIRFIPNSERFAGAEPDVKASVRLKRNDKGFDPTTNDKPDKPDKDREKDDEPEPRDSRSRLRFWRRDTGNGGGDDGER
jgi:hypothetical protein